MDALLSAVNSLNTGEIRYAPADGTPELKKSIIRYTEEYYHRKVNPENVIASGGLSKQLWLHCKRYSIHKEEVIFPAPYWVSYPDMAKLCGAIGVAALPEDGTFYPAVKRY